ncbi:MAG: DUF2782 domain-containing protein [Gammaproteobacteria bacterium]|nr:DUF2782 domain-containing protein [Gammaproteobacteria bacterium]
MTLPRALALILALCGAAVPVAAQQDEPDEPPVTIGPGGRGEQVEEIRLANGRIMTRVTPLVGDPYCFIIEPADPFDPFSTGANYRVPCR